MAEYASCYDEFRRTGVEVAAVSVDRPEDSAAVVRERELPSPLLCDADKQIVTGWRMLNSREKGGVAYPGVFVIDRERRVVARLLEGTNRRIEPYDVLAVVRGQGEGARAHVLVPGARDVWDAVKAAFRGRSARKS